MQRACLSSVRTVDGHAFPLSFLNICNGGIMDRRNVITVGVAIQLGTEARAEFLQYQLVHSTESPKQAMNAPASISELHEMKLPAAALKPGPYEFSMTRVTLPAGGATPRPHTRSGAALYYVLA